MEHYRLEMILAVGFRVRSVRGAQFRQWATARLEENLRKGFVMDDERLKHPRDRGKCDSGMAGQGIGLKMTGAEQD